MGKTPAHYPPAVRETIDWLLGSQSLAHLSWFERMSRTLDLWFYGFCRSEQKYMAAVDVLGKPATREAAVLVGKLAAEMMADPQDLLGKVYQEISANDRKRLAQYFTPDSVSKAMARMLFADVKRGTFTAGGPCRIAEPACGSGAMAVHGLVAVHEELGAWATRRVYLAMTDLDFICCQMAALQVMWLGLLIPIGRVDVFHGNSLIVEGEGKPERVCWFGQGFPPTRKMRREHTTRKMRRTG